MSLSPQQETSKTFLASKETLNLFAFTPQMGGVSRGGTHPASISDMESLQKPVSTFLLAAHSETLPPDPLSLLAHRAICAIGDDLTIVPKEK